MAESSRKNDLVELYPIFAAMVANLIWGFSNTFTKIAMESASIYYVLSVRFLIAIFALTLIGFKVKTKTEASEQERRNGFGRLILLGVIELIYFFCETYGIELTNVTVSGVVLAVSPIISMVFASVFLKEYPSKRQVVYSVVAVLGVVLITVSEGMEGQIQPFGLVLLAGGAICASVFRVLNRKIINVFSTFERSYSVVGVSAIGYTIMALIQSSQTSGAFFEPMTHLSFVLSVLVLSLGSSVGANMLANYAATKLSVVRLSVFGTICTLCSMTGGILFLGEPINWMSVLGAVLIILGIQQVNKK